MNNQRKPRPLPLPPLSKGGGAAAPEGFLPVVDCFPLTARPSTVSLSPPSLSHRRGGFHIRPRTFAFTPY